EVHLRGKPLAGNVTIDKLAEETDGYSGADIAAVCNEAVMAAIREYIAKNGKDLSGKEEKIDCKITMEHLEEALTKVKPMSRSRREQLEKLYCSFAENKP
ncbi:MAG: AAA family ATPase, partial [Candidatus Freyarchaeota archaeon]